MRVILYVFSGTGNTAKVAEEYRKNLYPHAVDIHAITTDFASAPNPNEYDLAGFGYPIHGFNAPEIVVKFARALPDAGMDSFIFKTSGEPLGLNDCASQKLIAVLNRKGYRVMSERHMVMPYNMIYRHTDDLANVMWAHAKRQAEAHVTALLAGETEQVKLPFYRSIHAPIVRIEWPFAKLHGRFFSVDANKCIDCGKCARHCPAANITRQEDGSYRFGGACTLCVRCSFHCPKDAIHIGILNAWKVNGAYPLEETAPALETVTMPNLYRKYFSRLAGELETKAERGEMGI